MKLRDAIHLAGASMRSSSFRTLLAVLGLAVGVGAVIAVTALGDAGEERVETEIGKLGVNKVWIRSTTDAHPLMLEDSDTVMQTTHAPSCAGAYTAAKIEFEGIMAMVQIAAFDELFEEVLAPKIREGRLFSTFDHQRGSMVCLIDERLAEQFGGNPIGQRIFMNYRCLEVIGIIKGLTAQSMATGKGMLVLPMSTYLDTFDASIAEITISVPPKRSAEAIADVALDSLGRGAYLRADTLEKEINAAREIVRIFVSILLCVAFVCMITGGIGIMNVLLLTIRERRKEIGLMKAVGAHARQIGIMFLLEALGYAALGGLLGIASGIAMTLLFSTLIGLHVRMNPWKIAVTLLAAILLGGSFGVLPALHASKLQPVQALRDE